MRPINAFWPLIHKSIAADSRNRLDEFVNNFMAANEKAVLVNISYSYEPNFYVAHITYYIE